MFCAVFYFPAPLTSLQCRTDTRDGGECITSPSHYSNYHPYRSRPHVPLRQGHGYPQKLVIFASSQPPKAEKTLDPLVFFSGRSRLSIGPEEIPVLATLAIRRLPTGATCHSLSCHALGTLSTDTFLCKIRKIRKQVNELCKKKEASQCFGLFNHVEWHHFTLPRLPARLRVVEWLRMRSHLHRLLTKFTPHASQGRPES